MFYLIEYLILVNRHLVGVLTNFLCLILLNQLFIEDLTNLRCLILVTRLIIQVLTDLMRLILFCIIRILNLCLIFLNRILRVPLGPDRLKC
jgi:hypothetical protein